MAEGKRRRRKRKDRIPGIILTIILFMVVLVFHGLLFYTDMLPLKHLGILFAISLLVLLMLYLLLRRIGNWMAFTVGVVLSILFVGALAFGGLYIYRTYTAITDITDVNVEMTEVNIYVKKESEWNTVSDLNGSLIGILGQLDRQKTDAAIEKMEAESGQSQEVAEYNSLTDLADALRRDECAAILLNMAYLDVLSDLDGYRTFSDEVKIVRNIQVKTEVENTPKQYTSKPLEVAENPKKEENKVYTILISGIDSREGLTASSLSDVNILVTLNLDTHQILLVSTPRDYFVPLSISNGKPDKLTHAGIYGIDVCMDTIGMLYDLDINYYFRLNFQGFVNIIDALGGITIQSDYEFDSQNEAGYHFKQGENFVDGAAALAFCRERYSFTEGDRQRGRNQMAVIKGMMEKLVSKEALQNYLEILTKTKGCFETNVPYTLIADIVKDQLKSNARWSLFRYSVNGTGDTQQPYSMSQNAYVMIPDQTTVEKAKDLMAKVRQSEILTDAEIES